MARKTKSTITVKLNEETKLTVEPIRLFKFSDLTTEQVNKLAETALRAKVAYCATKAIKEIAPSIQTNLSLKEEMLKAFPADAVNAFFQTKATEFPKAIEVNLSDVFKVEEEDEAEE